ncbi:MAG TPA: formylmethanofuran dehydrogenase subunit C [Gemmatimonadales bacterium]|nr:formylmethanofuran dehydrogenase subunit C [Gemmatimonadales bacterium]
MSDGLVATLRAPIRGRADFAEVLAGSWTALSAADLARRAVLLDGEAPVPLGDLFEVSGSPSGVIRLEGDLRKVDRIGAGLADGTVVVESGVGHEAGLGMSGGVLDVRGDAGDRVGGAAPEARKGMTGGELLVRGSVGAEPGTRMRRGLLVVTRHVAARAGPAMIAGTVVVFGDAGRSPGIGSKRGSVVALGSVEIPATYRYACTYQPDHLRLLLVRLRDRYGLKVQKRHLTGFYRRYSGDLGDLGRGEILAWTAE